MKQVSSASFQEYLKQVQKFGNHILPNTPGLLKQVEDKGLPLHAQAPIFYVADYVQQKIRFPNPCSKTFLGYDLKHFAEGSLLYHTNLWHKCDFEVANKKIFPCILDFLQKQLSSDIPNFSFSFNHRIKAKEGNYCTVIQRFTFLVNYPNTAPLAAVGSITDISHFKEDTKIIFTIEKVNNTSNSSSPTPLHKAVYFPEKASGIFSKREIEILECIYQGMSSKQIADKLFISPNTVHNHRRKMLLKTNCTNSAELISYALKQSVK